MLLPHFQSWMIANRVKSGDRILCAVSGGIDSMVMLDLFRKTNISFDVMHMNYQLRAEASDLDQKLVENICAKHNIPCHSKRVRKPDNYNTQEWARDERYTYIAELDEKFQYQYIATAHHQQDQLETILLSIFKGYSLQTIKGIRNKLIRPLLDVGKEDILNYASANDIEYHHDQSNFSITYDRNFLRNELIPPLRNRFQNFDKRVLKFAERQTRKNNLLDQLIYKNIKVFSKLEFNNLRNYSFEKIDLKLLKEVEGKTCLHYYLEKTYGFNQSQLDDLLESNQASASILNQHFICKKESEHLLVGKVNAAQSSEIIIHKADLPFQFANLKLESRTTMLDPKKGKGLMVDFDQVNFPLKLRRLAESDKFQAFGLRGKSTSLSKFLKDKGISGIRRPHEYVLIDASDRIIVPGIEIDYGLKITNSSKTALIVDLQDKSS